FETVVTYPQEPSARASSEYALLLAQQRVPPTEPGYRKRLVALASERKRTVQSRLALVERLEARGARVLVTSTATASAEESRRAAAEVRAGFGALHGVLHVAGGEPEASLSETAPGPLHRLLHQEVQAATALASLAADDSLDFVATLSPLAALRGARGRLLTSVGSATREALAGGPGHPRLIHWEASPDAEWRPLESALAVAGAPRLVVHAGEPQALRAATRAPRAATPQSSSSSTDEVERELLAIWRQLIGNERLGPHDDFHALGGDSLLASQVISRVRQHFSVDVSVKALFEAPTVAGLAERVRRARGGTGEAEAIIQRVPRTGPLPLSFAQQALWFSDQFNGASPTYNIPGAVRLEGALDVPALVRGLRDIVQRHEVLRTTFHEVDGVPVQVIGESQPLEVAVRDVSAADVGRLAQEFARATFDLSQGPLFRAELLRVSDQVHVLLVNMHHIVSDGWSLGVIIHELMELYSAARRGTASPLPPLAFQYVDYAEWQRQRLQGGLQQRQLQYWRHQLAGMPPLLKLPTSRPRPEVLRIRGAVHPFTLSRELTQRLHALSRQQQTTLFMTLLAGFKLLLSRYAGTTDIPVGTTSANRPQPSLEPLIGLFVNNLVLRTRLDGNPTFQELLGRVRTTALDAFAHQDLPFLSLVGALRQGRSLSHSPLFQVLFVLQKLDITLELPGLKAQTLEVDALHTKFDLTLFMEEKENVLGGTFIYNAELFDPPVIARMAEHLLMLLTSITTQPDARIDALRMETAQEEAARIMS
ncbi:MAG: condensation domain-containing protein, partial [Archangium sp.]